MLDRLRFDIYSALRSLAATPLPAAAAVLTLAVAAGVNLAMYGLIDRAILSPPRYVEDPDRVFTLGFALPDASAGAMTTTSFVTFSSVRDRVAAIEHAAAFQRSATSVVIDSEQRRVNAMFVTGVYFDLLGVRPMIGRGIVAEHDQSGAAPVVVLSHQFWRSTYGGDRSAIGRRLLLRGREFEIVGVMPDGFSGHSATDVDLWMPLAAVNADQPGWDRDAFRNVASVIVKASPGSNAVAVADQATVAINRKVTLSPIVGADVSAADRRIAWWLAAVSGLVFVIGLANAAALLLLRASKRRRELVVRLALGASRPRLISQALLEAAIVSLAASAASLLLASWFDESIRRVLFTGVIARGGITMGTLTAAAVAGVIAAVVAGAANIWNLPSQTGRVDLSGTSRSGGRRPKTMTALLVVQTTLSVLLLAGAGLVGRSLYNLAEQDFGMRMQGVVLVDFEQGGGGSFSEREIFTRALDGVRTLPGVEMATVMDAMPFNGFNVPPISVPGRPRPQMGQQLPYLTAATPEFLQILGVQIIEGRGFAAGDDRGPLVVIVNEPMARGVWPGESAIGKCIRVGFDPDFDPEFSVGPPTPSDRVPCRQVIGVARALRQRSLLPVDNEDRLMQYFVPFSQVPKPPFAGEPGPPVRGLVLRTSVDAATLAPSIRKIVVGPRTDLPFVSVTPYERLLDRQMRPWRLGTTLLALFSALALAVAAVGLYGAFAQAVAERRHEMAIRLAIGASPFRVLRLVLREAIVLAIIGVVCGTASAVMAARWMQSLLFGTAPSDPIVLLSAAGVMVLVAIGATWWPARTAARTDPNVLLRVS